MVAALGLLIEPDRRPPAAPNCTVPEQPPAAPAEPPRESPAAVILRRRKVWGMRCRGHSTYKIGEALGVDHSTVVRDLAAMNELRRADRGEAAATAEAQKEEAVGRYEIVIEEAMMEWERSKSDKQRQSAKEVKGPAKGPKGAAAVADRTETQAATEGRLADSQYLKVAVAAQKEIDGLNGLVKTKHEVTGAGGEPLLPVLVREVVVRSREEAKGVLDSLAKSAAP
jgi:hypothetical protein